MTSEVFDVYELLGFADVLRAFKTMADARAFLQLPADERRVGSAATKAEWSPRDAGVRIEATESDLSREWQSLQVEATTVGERGEIAVLSLRGIIDTVSAEKLRGALDQVISGGRVRVVADMSQVEYVSSGGWGVFTERLRELRRAGGDIKLFGMDPDVYYVFTMLGFNIVLSSFDIMGEAIDDFRTARADVDATAVDTMSRVEFADPHRPVAAPEPRVFAGTPGMDIVWEHRSDGVRIARISGVIETTAVSLLSDELTRELATAPRAVVFDLSRVEYISSSGWGQFARAYDATRAVALFGMGPELDDVYACLEFHSFLPAFATESEAVGAVLADPAPARPAHLPESESDDVTRSDVDDVLAGKPSFPPLPAAPSPRAPREAATRPPVTDDDELFDPLAEAPRGDEAPLWGKSTWSGKAQAPGSDLDVSSAKADRNLGRDRKLRALGWEKYGKRLKGRSDAGKLKDEGGGGLDPEDGGKS
jgi:anti-anti-sigma factor